LIEGFKLGDFKVGNQFQKSVKIKRPNCNKAYSLYSIL